MTNHQSCSSKFKRLEKMIRKERSLWQEGDEIQKFFDSLLGVIHEQH